MENQTTQPKKKESKWDLVIRCTILFILIIGIATIGGEKKGPSENIQPQQEVSKIVKFVNSLDGLKLRAQPSLSAGVLEVLKDKTEVEVLKEEVDWSFVTAEQQTGWVASRHLTTQRKIESKEEKLKFVKVTVIQLAKDFYSNSQAAGQKYGHRILEISGEVKEIDHSDEISVLEFKNTVIPVLCRFYSSRNQLAKFEQGGLITVRGEVYPQLILGVLTVEDCELIEEGNKVSNSPGYQSAEEKIIKESQPQSYPSTIPGLDHISVADGSGWCSSYLKRCKGFQGVEIQVIYWNKYINIISDEETAKVPITAEVLLYTSESYGKKGRLVASKKFSSNEIETDWHYQVLRIPQEEMSVVRGADSQYGIAEVVVHTPEQGSFKTTDKFIQIWE